MKLKENIKQIEFEARIFVSFSIVIIACLISITLFADFPSNYVFIFNSLGIEEYSRFVYLIAAGLMILASVLRMWAGSLLSSKTVMSFKVQSDSFVLSGPYLLIRNPIYFSDWFALTIISFFLPVSGLLIPVLFYIHYIQLIKYEEEAFNKIHTDGYSDYLKKVPRLIPSIRSTRQFLKAKPKISLNKDGIRHNALFILFIPGFMAGYFTGSFLLTALIGIPAVIDWGIVHTKIGLPKSSKQKKSKVFSNVLYSQCWEDPQIDREAFNIQKDDVVFSITSGGCNLLTFLMDDPKSVIALDLNPYQNYLLELKIAAFKFLSYEDMLEFVGVHKSKGRKKVYDSLKYSLSNEAYQYWNENIGKVERGIIHCGRYENYMKLLRNCIRLLVTKRTIKKFFESEDKIERAKLYDRKWDTLRWELFTKVLLSKKTMSLLFDKAFFKYLNDNFSFGDHFAEKTRRALTGLPIKQNYFLRYILLGNYNDDCLPYYLRKENFELIKSRLNRIQIITDSCDKFFRQLRDGSISKFNFTNIFEWISEDAFENLLNETTRVAKDEAVITYRNLLVSRERPESLSDHIITDKNLAEQLHKKDLSFIYNKYVVEKIIKKEEKCLTELLKYQHEKN